MSAKQHLRAKTGHPAGVISTAAMFALTCFLPLANAFAGTTNSWRVFSSVASAPTGPNIVANPGMETAGTSQPLASWAAYGSGYTASTTTSHNGTRSLQCTAATSTDVHGGYQTVILNQTAPKALKLSGWSKAQNVTGSIDSDYSVYLDILYTNGTPLWGQTINFSTGTHDWEYREFYIVPALPISQLNCYALLRNSHTGTVWFDDISITEVQASIIQFDGAPVASNPPNPRPFDPTTRLTLQTGDGLQLQLTQDGGVFEALADGTNNLFATNGDYASGWFVCDRAAASDWWNIGGAVASAGGALQQNGTVTNLNLSAQILYSVTNNAIRIETTLSNLVSSDRAVSVYFALPVAMPGGWWWNSPRDRVSLTQAAESATLSTAELGARNLVSQYPLATIASSGGLTLAIAPDQYRPFRLIYNQLTHQFFAAFDLGLSSVSANFPQTANVEIWLYHADAAWGLRSGLETYYRLFPSAFARNFTNEGIWVAFADIRGITNVSDFGIAYHEIGYNSAYIKSDDTNGIQSFRYVSEPWSYWMNMPTSISNNDYTSVYNYLLSRSSQGVSAATATLSSGVRDTGGHLEFFPAAEPWCPYGAAFYNNPSPFISDPQYPVTKFSNEWNATVQDVYNHPENGVLDGEYIDSFGAYASTADYSSNHLRTTSFPLAYTRDNLSLMTPLVLGTYEMCRAIGRDVHALGKPIIANTLYTTWPGLPIGIGLFDFAGTEINWFDSAGNLLQPPDSSLLYARALSGVRPYGFLMNTDFTKVSQAEMETYMQLCAVYGIYPSAFSANASSNNYFEQPALYERDRPLFKKYVPIVRAVSLAGWQPVTAATSDNSNVGIEAFGTNAITATRYFTVRNLSSQSATAKVSFDLGRWASPSAKSLLLTNLFDGGILTLSIAAGNSVSLTLAGYECRVYAVQAAPSPAPTILLNDGNFGFRTNQFGFNISAWPGQTVVVQAATNMATWADVQTNVAPLTGLYYFSDPASPVLSWRVYRASSP